MFGPGGTVGPEDLVESVRSGIDMFDCVMPTRNARNGQLFTSLGRVNIKNAKFADLGTGAGLPAVPLLIARNDLRGVLVESKLKKANFLEEVLAECKLEDRAEILDRQFEELSKPDVSYILCRALDKFTQKLPKILKWSGKCNLLFFGGNALRDELEKNGVKFETKLLPLSEQRFLFIAGR